MTPPHSGTLIYWRDTYRARAQFYEDCYRRQLVNAGTFWTAPLWLRLWYALVNPVWYERWPLWACVGMALRYLLPRAWLHRYVAWGSRYEAT